MPEDNSLITRTLAALLTEQHVITETTRKQVDFSRQLADVVRQQGELLKEQTAASERQASRIEELIGLMGSFADGGTELRQRLGRCEERLDKLEDAG